MQVQGINERHMVRERDGAPFVVFIYYGSGAPQTSWAVDSRLVTDADLLGYWAVSGRNFPETAAGLLASCVSPRSQRPSPTSTYSGSSAPMCSTWTPPTAQTTNNGSPKRCWFDVIA